MTADKKAGKFPVHRDDMISEPCYQGGRQLVADGPSTSLVDAADNLIQLDKKPLVGGTVVSQPWIEVSFHEAFLSRKVRSGFDG